jgi:hypothetical protein
MAGWAAINSRFGSLLVRIYREVKFDFPNTAGNSPVISGCRTCLENRFNWVETAIGLPTT